MIYTEEKLAVAPKVAEFLGEDGIKFFTDLYDKHGMIPLVIPAEPGTSPMMPPHMIHFREGMQIRNFLRRQPECADWDDIELDDNYLEVVCYAIDRDPVWEAVKYTPKAEVHMTTFKPMGAPLRKIEEI